MDRRRAAGALLALAACIVSTAAAPTASDQTALDLYDGSEGCYYNFQHYGEGDRIMTNEPCLNCTCHNRMLMCYLRVCPFTKPIGQDCTVEKRADQCCPIVTCPDVPVDLLTSTSTSSPAEYGSTGVGKLDRYGCSINGKYFPEGAKVPPSPNKPCEHCYCIRNMTTCVMQECTLHVDGCTPIYHKDVCCPIRYSCDHTEDDMLLLDDMTTTVRPTEGFLLTTTTLSPVTQMTQDCVHDDQVFSDGALIKTPKPCNHCYCMKGDMVCVVQECGTPMENEGKNCTSLPPKEGQCCPDTYICEGDEITTDTSLEYTTKPFLEESTTLSPSRRVSVEGSGYRKEPGEPLYTELPITQTESETEFEGSGHETTASMHDFATTSKASGDLDTITSTEKSIAQESTTSAVPILDEEDKATTEPDKGENTIPSGISDDDSLQTSVPEKVIPTETTTFNADTSGTTASSLLETTEEEEIISDVTKSDKEPETVTSTHAPSTQKIEESGDITTTSESIVQTPSAETVAPTELQQEGKSTTAQLPQQTLEISTTESIMEATTLIELESSTPKDSSTEKELTEEQEITTKTSLDEEVTTPSQIVGQELVPAEQSTTEPEIKHTTQSGIESDIDRFTTVPPSTSSTESQDTKSQTSAEQTESPTTSFSEENAQSTTQKHLVETTTPAITETTTSYPSNEIEDEVTTELPPGRIPGEGDCLLNGITYRNESVVPSTNKCHTGCKCISSIVKCDPIICSPPPEYMDNNNCQTVYDSPESCCPTYVCDHSRETIPPQPDSHVSHTEAPQGMACTGDDCDKKEKLPSETPIDCTSGDCLTNKFDGDVATKTPEECGGVDCNKISVPAATDDLIPECSGENCRRKDTPPDQSQVPTKCSGDECKKEQPTSFTSEVQKQETSTPFVPISTEGPSEQQPSTTVAAVPTELASECEGDNCIQEQIAVSIPTVTASKCESEHCGEEQEPASVAPTTISIATEEENLITSPATETSSDEQQRTTISPAVTQSNENQEPTTRIPIATEVYGEIPTEEEQESSKTPPMLTEIPSENDKPTTIASTEALLEEGLSTALPPSITKASVEEEQPVTGVPEEKEKPTTSISIEPSGDDHQTITLAPTATKEPVQCEGDNCLQEPTTLAPAVTEISRDGQPPTSSTPIETEEPIQCSGEDCKQQPMDVPLATEVPSEEQSTGTSAPKIPEIPSEEQSTGTPAPLTTEVPSKEQSTGTSAPMVTEVPIEEESTDTPAPLATEVPREEQSTSTSAPLAPEVPIEEQSTDTPAPLATEVPSEEQSAGTSAPMAPEEPSEEQTTGTSAPPSECTGEDCLDKQKPEEPSKCVGDNCVQEQEPITGIPNACIGEECGITQESVTQFPEKISTAQPECAGNDCESKPTLGECGDSGCVQNQIPAAEDGVKCSGTECEPSKTPELPLDHKPEVPTRCSGTECAILPSQPSECSGQDCLSQGTSPPKQQSPIEETLATEPSLIQVTPEEGSGSSEPEIHLDEFTTTSPPFMSEESVKGTESPELHVTTFERAPESETPSDLKPQEENATKEPISSDQETRVTVPVESSGESVIPTQSPTLSELDVQTRQPEEKSPTTPKLVEDGTESSSETILEKEVTPYIESQETTAKPDSLEYVTHAPDESENDLAVPEEKQTTQAPISSDEPESTTARDTFTNLETSSEIRPSDDTQEVGTESSLPTTSDVTESKPYDVPSKLNESSTEGILESSTERISTVNTLELMTRGPDVDQSTTVAPDEHPLESTESAPVTLGEREPVTQKVLETTVSLVDSEEKATETSPSMDESESVTTVSPTVDTELDSGITTATSIQEQSTSSPSTLADIDVKVGSDVTSPDSNKLETDKPEVSKEMTEMPYTEQGPSFSEQTVTPAANEIPTTEILQHTITDEEQAITTEAHRVNPEITQQTTEPTTTQKDITTVPSLSSEQPSTSIRTEIDEENTDNITKMPEETESTTSTPKHTQSEMEESRPTDSSATDAITEDTRKTGDKLEPFTKSPQIDTEATEPSEGTNDSIPESTTLFTNELEAHDPMTESPQVTEHALDVTESIQTSSTQKSITEDVTKGIDEESTEFSEPTTQPTLSQDVTHTESPTTTVTKTDGSSVDFEVTIPTTVEPEMTEIQKVTEEPEEKPTTPATYTETSSSSEGTTASKDEYSETTPYFVELELHTHKPEEEATTTSPLNEESVTSEDTEPEKAATVPSIETESPYHEKDGSSPITESVESDVYQTTQSPSFVSQETTPIGSTTQDTLEGGNRFGEEDTVSQTIQPTDKEKGTSVSSDMDTESSTTPLDVGLTEKEPTTEKPVESSNETTAPEEEFIPVSTKGTTSKIEEETATPAPSSMDKFTKPEEKPSETITTTPSAEQSKPSVTEPQPTDEVVSPGDESQFPPSGSSGYGQEPDYVEEDQDQAFGPGTCRYGGKVYVSAQQIPRDDPCDFCFCFRSDIICLQQSCPPPIHGCHEEPIQGFCCPRYECPVSMATSLNVTTTTTTTTTTLPPHFLPHAYKGAAQRRGCQIKGHTYKVGEVVRASSGPCLHCTCGGDGKMKCDPKQCTPEPMLRQMIAAAVSAKRRR